MGPIPLRAALGALRRRFAPARLRRASPLWLMLACLLLLSGCALVPWAQAVGSVLIALAALVLSACGGGSSGASWPSEIVVGDLSSSQGFIVQGDTNSDHFGSAVAAGDLNGDGIDDLAISAPLADTANAGSSYYDAGQIYVLFGASDIGSAIGTSSKTIGTLISRGMNWIGISSYAYEGESLAFAKDMDGDGIGELIIGSPRFYNGYQKGRAWVLFGDDITWHTSLSRFLQPSGGAYAIATDGSQGFQALNQRNYFTDFGSVGARAALQLGSSVVALDVNGDGLSETAFGAPYGRRWNPTPYYYTFANPRVTVVFGQTNLQPTSSQINVRNTLSSASGFHIGEPFTQGYGTDYYGSTWGSVSSLSTTFFGDSMAAGDMNNDGYDDLIIGANQGIISGAYSGGALVVFGKSGVTPSFTQNIGDTSHLHVYGIPNGYYTRVNYLGDVNGDNVGDMIITGPNYNVAYVVFGVAGDNTGRSVDVSSLDGTDGFQINLGHDTPGSNFQSPRTAAGHDVNGDGINDILLGVGGQGETGSTDVVAHVIFGSSTLGTGGTLDLTDGTLGSTKGFTIKRSSPSIHTIKSVAFGDINGDGKQDLIIGAYRDPESTTNLAGRVIVVFGKFN